MRVGGTKGAERQLTGDPDESSWRWTAERQLTGDPDESSWRWTAERRANRVGVEPRTGAVNTGLRRPVADKMGSSEENRLKMSAFELLVEFSLVTHASNSPHMHVVSQYLLFALG